MHTWPLIVYCVTGLVQHVATQALALQVGMLDMYTAWTAVRKFVRAVQDYLSASSIQIFWGRAQTGPEGHEGAARPSRARPGGDRAIGEKCLGFVVFRSEFG